MGESAKAYRISSHSFNFDDNTVLVNQLLLLAFRSTLHSDNNQCYVYILTSSAPAFTALLVLLSIPCMRYKLHL